MSLTQQVLAVLVADRQRAVAYDFAHARSTGLRRDAALAVYALAKAFTVMAVALDDEPGTVRA